MACLFHKWDGCKCSKCGEIREKKHHYSGCQCIRCGTKRDYEHDYKLDSIECYEVCVICGKKGEVKHEYTNGICKKCGKQELSIAKDSNGTFRCPSCSVDITPIVDKQAKEAALLMMAGLQMGSTNIEPFKNSLLYELGIKCVCGETLKPCKK